MTTRWQGWFGLGGQIKGNPAVTYPTAETIDIYACGKDDRLLQKWWDGTNWHPSDLEWAAHEDGGFRIGSAPAVVSNGLDFRDVYVRGIDGSVLHKFWDGKKWNGWFGLGCKIKGAPAVVNPTPSTIDIYVRGMDDRLYQKWWDGSKWGPSDTGWLPHDDGPFRLASSPAVVSGDANFRDIYVLGMDQRIYHKFWDGKKWYGWFGLGGLAKEAPSVVRVNPAFLDVYVLGTDNRLWQKWWDGSKWNPSDAGWVMHHDGNVRLTSAPSVASQGNSYRDVYIRYQDTTVLHKSWNNQKHSNAQEIRADVKKSAVIDSEAKFLINAQPGSVQPGLAIAVISKGTIVHLAGYGVTDMQSKTPITSETMFHMASCGKQFTGLGILMLKEAGKLSYDDHIGKHIPELAGYDPKVTIRRLLDHTSDIRDLYDDASLTALLKESGGAMPTNADVVKAYVTLGLPMNPNPEKPGDRSVYSNSEYDLLGTVIERLSGQSYVDFFRTRIFNIFGMTDTFSLPDTSRMFDFNRARGHVLSNGTFVEQPVDIHDSIVGSGSFYASVYDLCAYEHALQSNFIVSSLKDAYTSGKLNDGTDSQYGFGWGLPTGAGFAHHSGLWSGFTSYIRRYLNQSFSIYILCNNTSANLEALANVAAVEYK